MAATGPLGRACNDAAKRTVVHSSAEETPILNKMGLGNECGKRVLRANK